DLNEQRLEIAKKMGATITVITYLAVTQSEKKFDLEYMDTLLSGVREKNEFIVSVVARYAKGFVVDRIYRIDLALLKVAIYELLFTDTPEKVVVNEAVELAKIYSTDNSPGFINGLLATVIMNKESLTNECNAN
ncbi:MAG: transcription antitermination factor NusB, partial [Clostridia bacterium]|nr:transcription antitermination factor NusB [Clostridia bacterium]